MIDGTRTGAPSRASGDGLVVAREVERRRPPASPCSALPSQPSVSVSASAGGLPDVHRAEVRLGRVRIADALHDAQRAVLQQLGQAGHRRVQAEVVVELLDLVRRQLAASAGAWRSRGP